MPFADIYSKEKMNAVIDMKGWKMMYFNNNSFGWNGTPAPMGVNNQYNPLTSTYGYQPQLGYHNQTRFSYQMNRGYQPQSIPAVNPNVPLTIPTLDAGNGTKPIYPGYKIRQGDSGEIVKVVQRRLGLPADGVYTPQVEAMVRRFQQDNKVEANGMVGPNTWEKMFGSSKANGLYSVRNDTEKDAIILWTGKKCRSSFYGIPNVCHYELVLPNQVQTYEFDEKTSNRRVGILRKGTYRTIPISNNVPDGHEFSVSSIKSSGVKLSRTTNQRMDGSHRREFMNRMQAMMSGVVNGVKERLPFLY